MYILLGQIIGLISEVCRGFRRRRGERGGELKQLHCVALKIGAARGGLGRIRLARIPCAGCQDGCWSCNQQTLPRRGDEVGDEAGKIRNREVVQLLLDKRMMKFLLHGSSSGNLVDPYVANSPTKFRSLSACKSPPKVEERWAQNNCASRNSPPDFWKLAWAERFQTAMQGTSPLQGTCVLH